MYMALFGTVIIAGIIGYASEKSGFTHNGYVPSIIICIGGGLSVLLLYGHVRFRFRQSRRERDRIVHRGVGDRADALSQTLKGCRRCPFLL